MRIFRALTACLLSTSFAVAERTAPTPVQLTPHQAKVKSRVATTEKDFQELAKFYREQESLFAAAGKEQQQAYEYAIGHWGSKSYPQPAVRARLLSDYYEQRSSESRRLADAFTRKADALHQQLVSGKPLNP